MICNSCLKELKSGSFCLSCRKSLFEGKNISNILEFSKPKFESFIRDIGPKFSISGVQDKVSLKFEGDKLIPTESGGEYILKPCPSSVAILNKHEIPANEHLTMQIAKQVYKMNVAPNAIMRFDDGELACLVKRFDRTVDGTKRRQEDFCQILNITEEINGNNYKYNGFYSDAIPIFEAFVSGKTFGLEEYFGRIVFNYAYQNGDAHFKNFSLLEIDEIMSLSPLYDVLNTRIHSPKEYAIALEGLYPNGEESVSYRENGFYNKTDFLLFADKLGIKVNRADKIIDLIVNKTPDALMLLGKSFLSLDTKVLYKEYVTDRGVALRNTLGLDVVIG
jgi:serine/threonine-protein kinase HipA